MLLTMEIVYIATVKDILYPEYNPPYTDSQIAFVCTFYLVAIAKLIPQTDMAGPQTPRFVESHIQYIESIIQIKQMHS